MNLADIRKKAEENRRSASAGTTEAINDSVQLPEFEAPESVYVEEPAPPRFEPPGEDPAEDFFIAAVQPPEADSCEPDTTAAVFCPDELFAEQSFIPDAETGASEVVYHPLPAAMVPKGAPGNSPLATILAGRESATEMDDNSLFQATSYSPENVEEYLCFKVADEVYAISIMAIKEIVKPREVTEVPRMPAFITGVLSLRGVIIPVMDMRLRLSLPLNAATGRERIVVLRRASGFCGVLVDEVIQVARINRADIEAPPAVLDGIDRDFVTGLGHFDHRILILLNLETILDIGVH